MLMYSGCSSVYHWWPSLCVPVDWTTSDSHRQWRHGECGCRYC